MTPTLEYAIYRLNWYESGGQLVRLPGSKRLENFPAAVDAEAALRSREHDLRQQVNPFCCGSELHYLTTFPPGILMDYLRDAGMEPPTDTNIEQWAAWWERELPSMTALQRAKVWEGLDKVRFHEVRSIDPARIGYAVIATQWNYNDSGYSNYSEGGAMVRVFRTRAAAEREQHEREEAMRVLAQQDGTVFERSLCDRRWPKVLNGGYVHWWAQSGEPAPELFFFDIVEVELPA